jgi:hypothetical protein
MKITGKTLMVSISNTISVGNNNAIEATLEHQACLYENKDGSAAIEIDFNDVTDVKFLGMPIESGYTGYKKFKTQMLDLGIDVEKLIDEATTNLFTHQDIKDLKNMFKPCMEQHKCCKD